VTDNVWKFRNSGVLNFGRDGFLKVITFKSRFTTPTHTTTATLLYCLSSTLSVQLSTNSYILGAGGFPNNTAVDTLQNSFEDSILR
jgi:hypothetical protein